MWTILVLAGVTSAAQAGAPGGGVDLNAQQLLQVMDDLHSPLRDLYCEYEGRMQYTRKADHEALGLADDGTYVEFSGRFSYKYPDYYYVDIYRNFAKTRSRKGRLLQKETICSAGSKLESFWESDGRGTGETRSTTPADLGDGGCYGRIYLRRYLRELLMYSEKSLIYEGNELIEGEQCDRYAVVLGTPPYRIDDPEALVHRFWVNMPKSGNICKHETFKGKRLLERTHRIVLESVAVDGGKVWLPVHGEYEASDGTEVGNLEIYNVLRPSVRVNKGLDAAQFSIKYKIGSPITDRLKGVVFEYGQDRRRSPETLEEAQRRLDEAVRGAEGVQSRRCHESQPFCPGFRL